jgi:spore germination protein YaaH
LFAAAMLLPLIILAMFLPPISLWDVIRKETNKPQKTSVPTGPQVVTVGGMDFLPLSPASPSIQVGELSISAPTRALTSSFAVHVESLPPADYLAGQLPTQGWYCDAQLPANHSLASPVYSLSQTGTPPAAFTLEITAEAAVSDDPAALELHLWNATTSAWEFYAAGADATGKLTVEISYLPRCVVLLRQAGSAREVGVTLAVTDTFSPDVTAANARLYPGSLHPTTSGALQVILAPGFETGQGYDVIPLVTNYDEANVIDIGTVGRILENAAVRSEHARQIAAFILSDSGYGGAAVDYREIPAERREDYTAFVRELATLLHSQGRTLTIILPSPTYNADAQSWNTGAYDWGAIGRAADEVVLTMPLDPRDYTPDAAVDNLLTWAMTQISRGKLLMGLSALSVEEQTDGTQVPISSRQALSYLSSIRIEDANDQLLETLESGESGLAHLATPAGLQAETGCDTVVQTCYVRYLDAQGNPLRTMWLMDGATLYERSEIAAVHHLNGIYVTDVMSAGAVPDLPTALLGYRLDQPVQPSTDLMVDWVLRRGDDEIAHETLPFSTPFTFDAGADPGTLTFEARLYGQLIASQTLQILATVETPTPAPTATPTLEPTVQPTETPVLTSTSSPAAAETPVPDATATPEGVEVVPLPDTPTPTSGINLDQPLPTVDPLVLAAVSLGTEFEAGVHLGDLGPSLIEANKAHLTWIKLEITFRIGSTPGAQQRNIEDLQASGFKVLISVTGDPDEFAAIARADYIAEYAAFVGGLALSGVDGIEIWEAMNMQMLPADYVQLLAYSYVAIKTANPGTLVITGALLPTASADNPDQSDSVYYDELAAAGAAQYADCIGEEYLLGTVSPSGTSGDPRGDSPVYYLPSATDRALHGFGPGRQVCYTRFGYLSPEGYAPLPEGYTWAQATTAAQQAQWLGEAIQLSREGSQIRMLIIWTLDATAFPPDSPDAGYAIIRPDGSCPACEALADLLKPAA